MQAILLAVAVLVAENATVPTPAPSTLPEIGRVKVVTPICASIVDVVLPAYDALSNADRAFDESVPSLENYAASTVPVRQPGLGSEALGKMHLSRIGQSAATQLQALERVRRALADPRLQGQPGSVADAERRHLEALYEIELARTQALQEFWLEHTTAAGRDEINALTTAMIANQMLRADVDYGSTELAPGVRPAPFDPNAFGQPVVDHTLDLAARADMAKWTRRMTEQVKRVKDSTSRFFLPLAQPCDDPTAAPAPLPSP